MSFHPENVNSNLVAVGSYDGKIRLLSTINFKLAFTLPLVHPKEMTGGIGNNIITTVEVFDQADNEFENPVNNISTLGDSILKNPKASKVSTK